MNFNVNKDQSQAGQGTVEYVLLMVVVVIVIFGFLSQFNSAFGAWSKNYFGTYVACLLEYGELPSLGGGTQVEGCDAQFEEFSLANGRNPFGTGIGETNYDNNKSKSGSGEGGGEGRVTADTSGRAGRSFLSGRGSSGAGSGGGGGRVGRFERAGGDGDEGDDLFGGGGRKGMTADGIRESVLRPRQIYLSYMSETEEKKAMDKKPVVTKEKETVNRPPRLAVREKSLRKTAAIEDSGLDLGFGGFIRFLFIIAIIIAIIILLGGQALQISKEWD